MTTGTITIDDLTRIMRSAVGDPGEGPDIEHREFADLGVDSLALMEMASHIRREFGVRIPEEQLPRLTTPADLLDAVNRSLTGA